MADLGSITSLGTIDAETDFRPEFFVPSTSWNSVRRGKHPIVIGRKGTGKTALRFALRDEAKREALLFSQDLAFRDYPWAIHFGIYDSSVGRSRYQETWIFLILVELAKLVADENQARPTSREADEALQLLRRFLTDTWGGIRFDHRDTFKRDRYRVVKGSLSPTVLGTGLGSIDWATVDRRALGDVLYGMNRWLRGALEYAVQRDAEYFLVFDELDLEFERENEQYLDSMVGLVLAAQNVYLWSKESGIPAKPVVLFRDDIYRVLAFPDKNKITMNLVEPIQWTEDWAGENSLKGVIDRRILASLDLTGAEDAWFLLFDEQVMRGTQPKYLHMVQRTYLRPRDMIQFANQCILEARRRGGLVDGSRIANEDVANARTAYSNYLRQELADELHAHYPGWGSWLELLRRVGRLTFSRDTFDAECAASVELTEGADPATILSHLYEFGIIGFARRGGAGRGGTDEYWSYRDADIPFDPDAPYFKVHAGLKENLDLKEERR